MEVDDGDEKSKFLAELEKYDGRHILCYMDNLFKLPFYREQRNHEKEIDRRYFQGVVDRLAYGREKVLQGIDLDDVKHFYHSHLSGLIDHFEGEFVIGKTVSGRFLLGPFERDSVIKYFTVKTWDLVCPPRDQLRRHPARLHNEIMLLTNELYSHPNLPKLIGYSIDKVIAVIYDLKPKATLRSALKSGNLGWDARVKVAIQVAELLQHFHRLNITIGSIDSNNILIDEGDDIKLCEFGLTARRPEKTEDKCLSHYAAGAYSFYDPELHASGGKWTTKTDIFAFGFLLLELITKEAINPEFLHGWADEELASGKTSIVHESLLDDEVSGSKITALSMNCLNRNQFQRPEAGTIAEELKRLTTPGNANKKQKLDTC